MSNKQNDAINEMRMDNELPPNAKVIISGKVWGKVCKVAKHMNMSPDLWIEKRIVGQLSRFTHKKWYK